MIKALREIGREKIMERLEAIKNGDPLPDDILASVLNNYSN
jgi:hypothetical protein